MGVGASGRFSMCRDSVQRADGRRATGAAGDSALPGDAVSELMIVLIPDAFDYYERSQPLHMSGSGHSVSGDEPDDDPAETVRKIAEEVTGKTFDRPRRKMGFL